MPRTRSRRSDPRFLVEDFEPAYLEVFRRGELEARVEAGLAELAECRACPRNCAIDRLAGELRVCNTGRHAVVSSAFPHLGEEDCLRGRNGSGTIFFALCNLRCVFCQNWEISQKAGGRVCTAEEIAACMLELQRRGCHNINFVTPEHVVPQVIEALALAVPRGLRLPIVYYMPDFKFWSRQSSRRLVKAKDYPERAREAIAEMHRQVGPLRFDRDGLAMRGVLVRHLVMPGQRDETAAIFEWLARALSPDTYVNIMGQYRPEHQVGEPLRDGRVRYGEIDRRPSGRDMQAAYSAAEQAGLWRIDERRASILASR
jgi:putative pyruvate formate lyase activating enzyme